MARTTTTTTTTALGALATLLLVPALLAGCSGGSGEAASGSSPSSSAGRPNAATVGDCLRKKGYDISDDELGIGKKTAQISVPEGVDVDQWLADSAVCTGTTAGAGEPAKPFPGTEKIDREAAACIREHGFADYPDDLDAKASYHPADEDTFNTVAKQCDDAAFAKVTGR